MTVHYVFSMTNTIIKLTNESKDDSISAGNNTLSYSIAQFNEKYPDYMITNVVYIKTPEAVEDPVGKKVAEHKWVIFGEKIEDIIK